MREGKMVYTDQTNFVYEILYSKDLPLEKTVMSDELYEKNNGEIAGEASGGERRKICTTICNKNGRYSVTTYNLYRSNGTLERSLRVDYIKLNKLLNEGKLNSIVPEAIEDVTKGLKKYEKIRTLSEIRKCLKACSRQILLDKMHSGERGVYGGFIELQNLILLAGLEDSEIKMVRFSCDESCSEKIKQYYDSVGALLGYIGINLKSIGNIDGDFIIIDISVLSGVHSVSVVIDLKKLRELKGQGKDIATTDELFIFIFDSSRVIGNSECEENNLSNIQKNCVFVNRTM
ncbi:MAG: hypothetical protein LBB24_02075 [Rickettsiales bacterium]|nr:hypothetical protein [Rickettsiales bacterium]